ncbi:glycosyltransferase family 4 protein [uncultured Nocardioides sp.]|uniref:glycosyltransferase family 4 protein n=1 Tax=uncultured Nocardioides sp. TaxID=198441 RepID=UPI0026336884|nr:glycosyltransferase family 4 protein [uncultured Nocardioides sp.]
MGNSGNTAPLNFSCVFRGSRDHYEVPAAFAEMGRLDSLVTDFYRPEFLDSWLVPSRARSKLLRRSHEQIPSKDVIRIHWASLPLHKPFFDRWDYDAAIGRAAARKVIGPAVVYSYYWRGFQQIHERAGRSSPAFVFQVHPVARQVRSILKADRERSGIDAGMEGEERFSVHDLETEEASLKKADGFLVASQFTKRGLQDLGVDSERVRQAVYGSDRIATAPRRSSWQSRSTGRPLRLLWIGQLAYRKGPHWLFEAARRLSGLVELTIVSRSEVPTWLQPLPDNVSLMRVEAGAMDRVFASHDAFVMPSLVEGFGLVYAEALRAGLPIIATANSGAPDIAQDGENAIFVEAGDLEGLVTSLSELAESRELLSHLRRGARDRRLPTWAEFRQQVRNGADLLAGSGGWG